MAVTKEEKAKIIKEFAKSKNDVGSAEVQIALLTREINDLTDHLKRGLFMKVGRRRKLLNYLKDNDVVSYREVIKKLNLRK